MNIKIQSDEIARIADSLAAMCGDDERLFADMVEGETDLHRLVERLHNSIQNDAAMVAGLKERKAAMNERQARFEARVDAQKAAIVQLMKAGRQAKLELPEVTYSVRDGKEKLAVLDPDAVPREYQRERYEPNKDAINEAFASAETLPNWLSLVPAKPILTGRTK